MPDSHNQPIAQARLHWCGIPLDRAVLLCLPAQWPAMPALWWYHTHATSRGIAAHDILLPVLPAAQPIRSTATRGAAHYADSLDE